MLLFSQRSTLADVDLHDPYGRSLATDGNGPLSWGAWYFRSVRPQGFPCVLDRGFGAVLPPFSLISWLV